MLITRFLLIIPPLLISPSAVLGATYNGEITRHTRRVGEDVISDLLWSHFRHQRFGTALSVTTTTGQHRHDTHHRNDYNGDSDDYNDDSDDYNGDDGDGDEYNGDGDEYNGDDGDGDEYKGDGNDYNGDGDDYNVDEDSEGDHNSFNGDGDYSFCVINGDHLFCPQTGQDLDMTRCCSTTIDGRVKPSCCRPSVFNINLIVICSIVALLLLILVAICATCCCRSRREAGRWKRVITTTRRTRSRGDDGGEKMPLLSHQAHPSSHQPHPSSHQPHPSSHQAHPSSHQAHPSSHQPHPSSHHQPLSFQDGTPHKPADGGPPPYSLPEPSAPRFSRYN